MATLRKGFLASAALIALAVILFAVCSDKGGSNPATSSNTSNGGDTAIYTLTVNRSPINGGTVACVPSKTAYVAGDTVTVTATAAVGYKFDGWTGAAVSKDTAAKIIINNNKTVTANFKRVDTTATPLDTTVTPTVEYTLTTNVIPNNGGTVTRVPNKTAYAAGDTVAITATAADGFTFDGWTGSVTSATVTAKIVMIENKTVTANFKRLDTASTPVVTYTLTVNQSPTNGGTVTRVPNKTVYTAGDTVTITATAAAGYQFDGWTGAVTSTKATTTIEMTGNKTVTANFGKDNAIYDLKILIPDGGGVVKKSPDMESYPAGTAVTLTAVAASGYKFDFWYVNASDLGSVKDTVITITVNRYTEVFAYFYVPQPPKEPEAFDTVKIGTQTWMAKNVNTPTQSGSWCFLDGESYCNKYGRLYDWNTAKTICPAGWHLPTRDEWGILAKYVGGTGAYGEDGVASWKLRSTSGWGQINDQDLNGTDDYGFAALPGGGWSSSFDYTGGGNAGYWWTNTEQSNADAYYRSIFNDLDDIRENSNKKTNRYSVRCVKD